MDKTVIYVCLTQRYTDDLYEKHFSILPPWRKEKVLNLQDGEKRKQSTLAFTLLSFALKTAFGIEDFAFIYNEHQKPYLAGGEAFFSISHCPHAVAVGVSPYEIGVDVEGFSRVRQNVLERMFSESERKMINSAKKPDFVFTKLWTEKEAFAKCTGRGIWTAERPETANAYTLSGWSFSSFYLSACTGKGNRDKEDAAIRIVSLSEM